MKMRTYYLWPLVGMVWFWNGSPALGQGDHQGNHEKDVAGFEHVHALAMDAEGRTLFLGAHTGLFRRGEVKVLTSVNISTGMGGIFLYAGTAEGLQRSPDCF